MVVFYDQTAKIDERNSERMHFRVKPRIKSTIQQAAALAGVAESVFAANAAYTAAMITVAAHERTALKPVDHAAFFAALDNPPAPNAKLQAAFERHKTTVISE